MGAPREVALLENVVRSMSTMGGATVLAALLLVSVPFSASAATSGPVHAAGYAYRYAKHGDFRIFFEDFRHAVLADDREAVARMTALPFRDLGVVTEPFGNACDEPREPCTADQRRRKRTSRDARELQVNYGRIFSPGMRAALQAGRYIDSGRTGDYGPLSKGEYLLVADDIDDQRVFARTGPDHRFRMVRIPFYS